MASIPNFHKLGEKFSKRMQRVNESFHSQLEQQPLLIQIEEASGVKKHHTVVGIVTFVMLGLALYLGSEAFLYFLNMIVILPYPLFCSFQVVGDANANDGRVHWLQYWIIYASTELTQGSLCFLMTSLTGEVTAGIFINTFQMMKFFILVAYLISDTEMREFFYQKIVCGAHRQAFGGSIGSMPAPVTVGSAGSPSSLEGGGASARKALSGTSANGPSFASGPNTAPAPGEDLSDPIYG
jgi:hypothetical protein